MGKGGQNVSSKGSSSTGSSSSAADRKPEVSWQDVRHHKEKTDQWLVIDGEVYDVTRWAKKHPGGSKVMNHFAGQDASEVFTAFHKDKGLMRKYMKPLHVGTLRPSDAKQEAIKADMEELRQTAQKLGYFTPSVLFYTLTILHIIAFEVFAYWVLATYGNGWIPWTLSVLAFATVQTQAGWTQHDFGHHSVFKSSKWNYVFQQYLMNFTKGAPAHWWQHLHNQHHAKPNVLDKDPDVKLDALFVVGETMAKKKAQSKSFSLPHNWQHRYWFATLPPLLFPTYFQVMIFRHCITRRAWLDLFTMCLWYVKFFTLYIPLLGFGPSLFYYFIMRVLESHWFVWVTQSNHIPMEVEEDKERPWLALQLYATCDIEKGVFNDWFTGHLNFQIEHHLFPSMPRHNLYKVAPLVKSLCQKHNIPYETKTLYAAFRDIVGKLESSGQIWNAYYHAYHMD